MEAVPLRVCLSTIASGCATKRSVTGLTIANAAQKYRPMLMHAEAQPFARKGWLFEPKMDGMRGIGALHGGQVKLWSRNALDFSWRYPALAEQLRELPDNTVVDGEIVAFDKLGRVSFERLQERIIMSRESEIMRADISNPVLFFVFDILQVAGRDVTSRCLTERKKILRETLCESSLIKHLDFYEDDGVQLFAASHQLGLEGIVAKNAASSYQCGTRSKNWVKVKHTVTADVVIGGHRKDYGFLVGRYDKERNLRYVGNVMGGLRSADYEYLDRALVLRDSSPFNDRLRSASLWFEPLTVAEVKFMHWTSAGYLRMPSFTRLRLDIDPLSVSSDAG
jgi:bifunctional non-homologous end joining protein LigD